MKTNMATTNLCMLYPINKLTGDAKYDLKIIMKLKFKYSEKGKNLKKIFHL